MKWLARNKFHVLAISFVAVLFLVSAQVRKENLTTPLSRHHEWIAAHTLITCEIWKENGGPSAYHFSPVYTYPGEGNHNRRALGGITDAKGDVYYVSYPPLSFLVAYYTTSLIGGPDTKSIRNLSLAIHFLCGVFIYLIGVSLAGDERKSSISIAGLLAAFLYLFSAGNLWAHGNLYFADMQVQLFVIGAMFLVSNFYQKNYTNEWMILAGLATCFFLAAYTEWLGIFLSFYTGLAFLLIYFFKRESRFLKAFAIIGFSASLALILMLWQYSSIAGWEEFKTVSTEKYQERSGHESAELSPNAFNLENEEAYEFMIGRINQFYKMAENFIGISGILFAVILIIPNTRRRMEKVDSAALLLAILGLAILTHYYVFFNFNSLHDFSSLKTSFFFALLVLVFIGLTETALSIGLRVGLFGVLAFIATQKGIKEVERYKNFFPIAETDWNRMETGAAIKNNASPHQAVFVNISGNPELFYAAHHNVFSLMDTTELPKFMDHFKNDHGQYYHHSNGKLQQMQEFSYANGKISWGRIVDFSGTQEGSGTRHQK